MLLKQNTRVVINPEVVISFLFYVNDHLGCFLLPS